MFDKSYYENKHKNELKNSNIREVNNGGLESFDIDMLKGLGIIVLIAFTVSAPLFYLMSKSLEEGRIECESKGGNWYSTMAGKVVITSCTDNYGNDIKYDLK